MSAWICENITINRFLSWIYWRNNTTSESIKRKLSDQGYFLHPQKKAHLFGEELLNMNLESFNQRYDSKEKLKDCGYKFEDVHKVTDLQALKSLSCFLYQCDNENVTDSKLYKFMCGIEQQMMKGIIDDLEEYKEAIWG